MPDKLDLKDVERVELTIKKSLGAENATSLGAENTEALSCFACFCTEGCMSSLGSVCSMADAVANDPQVAQALITLHDRSVAVLGEEGTAKGLQGRSKQAILR